MNVLIISEPGSSGVFTFVESISHYLISRGVRVHLAYSDRRGSDRLEALVRFVEASGGMTANMEVASGIGFSDVRAVWRLAALARRARPDVVHCHSSKAGVLGRSLALLGVDAAFLYHPHAYYGMRPNHGPFDAFYDSIEMAFGWIGATVVVSADERRFAMERLHLPARRLRTIPNGVDTSRFRPSSPAERESLRAAFGIPAGTAVLGTLSRLSAQKDPVTLYRAFAVAAMSHPDIHLFHLGTGELEPQIVALVAELGIGRQVTRLGYLADTTRFYASLDGFMLTSTYEGLSLASLEAMAAGLPLILSAAPGNVDLLELPLSHAWGAAPGDVRGFAACIGLWRTAIQARPTSNHRSVALERFDNRTALAEVLTYYYSLMRRKSRGVQAWSARLPVALWLGLIAAESTGRFTKDNTRAFLFPAFHLLTGLGANAFGLWNAVLRKVGHVVLYGTLSLLLFRLARFEFPRLRARAWSPHGAALAVAGTFVVAALDEWHQTMVPGRTGTVADVVLDTTAGLAAQALLFRALVRSDRPPGEPPGRSGTVLRPRAQSEGRPGRSPRGQKAAPPAC